MVVSVGWFQIILHKKWLEITKHPVNKWLALEFQDGMIEQNIHPAESERMPTLKKESFQGINCLPSFIFEERTVSFFGSTYGKYLLKTATACHIFPKWWFSMREINKTCLRSLSNAESRAIRTQIWTSWWFQPIWKILVKMDHFSKYGWTMNHHHLVKQATTFFKTALDKNRRPWQTMR